MITPRIDCVMYGSIHFINDYFKILNRTIAENYIEVSNKDSFFEYYEMIKYGQA